jgi:starvation-inducible outer membrane lipoprotein
MIVKRAIQVLILSFLLAGCAYCPPALKKDSGLTAARTTPVKIVAKDETEDGSQL